MAELLAPAGNIEALDAAIGEGADASIFPAGASNSAITKSISKK